MKELITKFRCLLGFHKWSYVEKDFTNMSMEEMSKAHFQVGRFNRYRFCLNCPRIEIDQTKTDDGLSYYSSWTKATMDRLKYEGFVHAEALGGKG